MKKALTVTQTLLARWL